MKTTKEVGIITEVVILARLVQKGYSVAIPFGQSERYDLIVDFGEGVLERVQCKTGRLYNGCVLFNAYSVAFNTTRVEKRPYTKGEIDSFITHVPNSSIFARVPIEDAPTSEVRLRIDQPKKGYHGSHYPIRWLNDYKF